MRYVAAYLLTVLGGNDKPSEADVKKILSSVGIEADDACLKKVIGELKGKDLQEIMTAGRAKLAAMPVASAGAPAAAAPAAAASKTEAPKKEEKKKEEPKEEEEEDEDMGFGLFD